MLLDHCYCPYIRTILKYVHHFANIAKSKSQIDFEMFLNKLDPDMVKKVKHKILTQ